MKNLLSALACSARTASKEMPAIITDLRSTAAGRGWPCHAARGATVQQCEPSRTIPEEMLELLRTAPATLRRDRQAVCPATPESAAMYYSQLHAVTRYPLGETFTCEIPGAVLAGPAGVAFTERGELLAQSSFDREIASHPPEIGNPAQLPGRWVSLLSLFVAKSNYAHWLMDALPRLALLKDRDDDCQFLVPASPAKFVIDSLLLAGIARDRIHPMPAAGARVGTLLLTHAAQRSGVPCAAHLLAIRDRLSGAAAAGRAQAGGARRIHISRAGSVRSLANEDELLPVLRAFGFECVRCEDLDFAAQVRLFSEASVVAGAHGAGIFNQLFCPPGSTVIEIFNHRWWDHAPRKIASLLGHRHWHLFGKSAGARHATWADPKKLHKLLSYALTGPEDSPVCDNPY